MKLNNYLHFELSHEGSVFFKNQIKEYDMERISFSKNDGGREVAGYKGNTGDCVTRAIAIATETPYQDVYDSLYELGKNWEGRSKIAKAIRRSPSPRNGCHVPVAEKYLETLGWVKVKNKLKLDDDKFKSGRYICSVRRHYTSMIDGVLNDTWDCQMTSGMYAEKTIKTAFHHYEKT
jgi:hypothetical protein